jgi:hypothetical protein
MTNKRYEILDRWGVALFVEDGILKSSPVGDDGVQEQYVTEVDLNSHLYTEGDEMEGFADDARAAQERLM